MGSQVGFFDKAEIGFNTFKNQNIYKNEIIPNGKDEIIKKENMYTSKMKVLRKIPTTTKLVLFLKEKNK